MPGLALAIMTTVLMTMVMQLAPLRRTVDGPAGLGSDRASIVGTIDSQALACLPWARTRTLSEHIGTPAPSLSAPLWEEEEKEEEEPYPEVGAGIYRPLVKTARMPDPGA